MKRLSLPVLVLLNLVLLAAVVAFWLLGETHWEAPAAQPPAPASLAAERISRELVASEALPQTLQRPLFAQTRRPPPPEEEVVAEAPPEADPLEGVQLLGVFTVDGEKHLMLRAEDKVSRLKQGERFGPWTIAAFDDRVVTFVQDGDRRQLELKRAPQPAAARAPLITRRAGRAAALDALRAGAEGGADASPDTEGAGNNPSPSAAVPAEAVKPPAAPRSAAGSAAEAIARQRGQR